MAAISATGPVASLFLERGDSDPELDEVGDHLGDAINILALVSKGVSVI